MYTKQQFEEIFKDSSKEQILNQFYYEHTQLYEQYKIVDETIKFIKEELEEYEKGKQNYKRFGVEDYTKGMQVAYKKCLERLDGEENE